MHSQDITESYPRIEAGDTFRFDKKVPSVANSAAISIWNPGGTLISSISVASWSATNSQYECYYTVATSYFTTVLSSGIHIIEWTLYRDTGDDNEKEYFEVIKTD